MFYDKIRGKIINLVCRGHLAISRYLQSFLNEKEKMVFHEMLTTYLRGDYSQPIPYQDVAEVRKIFDEKGTQCTILQQQVAAPPISMTYNLPSVPLIPADLAPMTKSVNLNRPVKDGPMEAFRKIPKSPDSLLDRHKVTSPSGEVRPVGSKAQSNLKIIESFAPSATNQASVGSQPGSRKGSSDVAQQEYNVLNQRTGKLIDELNMSVSEYSDILDFGDDNLEPTKKEAAKQLNSNPKQ